MSKKSIIITVLSFIGVFCSVPYIKGEIGEWGNLGPGIASIIFIIIAFASMGLFSLPLPEDEN